MIKRVFGAVDNAQKAVSGILWLITTVGILGSRIEPSATLRQLLALGAGLGGLAGFGFTVTKWAGKGREACLRRSRSMMWAAGIVFALTVLLRLVLQPQVGNWCEIAGTVREFLLDFPLLYNLLLTIGSGATMYWVVGSITLRAPRLWETDIRKLQPDIGNNANAD